MAAVHQLQGVGAASAALLEKLNLFTTDDLLFHLPRDYEDRSTIIPMNQLTVGRSYLSKERFKAWTSRRVNVNRWRLDCKTTLAK